MHMGENKSDILTKNYFAYGVNINEKLVEERCKGNIAYVGPAYLPDHKLVYGGGEIAEIRYHGSVLGVKREQGNYVMGICYKVNDKALELLDEIENARELDNPRMYIRKRESICLKREKEVAEVYVASDYFLKKMDSQSVSKDYIEIIMQGYYKLVENYSNKYNFDITKSDAFNYLKNFEQETSERGRFFRGIGKIILVIPVGFYFIMLYYYPHFFENFVNTLSFFFLALIFLILARVIINEGSAYGARCGRFEDMIFLMMLCGETNCSPETLMDKYILLNRDPSIIKLLEQSGNIPTDLNLDKNILK
jgi:hypothetical protein